jgi:small-conductance mechanosensitive channel
VQETGAEPGQAADLLRPVLPWGAVIVGVWVAVLRLPLSPGYRNDTDQVLLGAVIVVVTFGAARTVAELVRAGALSRSGTSGSATIFVNIARFAVIVVGALVLLDSVGIAITPLLTALGVGAWRSPSPCRTRSATCSRACTSWPPAR